MLVNAALSFVRGMIGLMIGFRRESPKQIGLYCGYEVG